MKQTQATTWKTIPILSVSDLPTFVWKEPAASEAKNRNTEYELYCITMIIDEFYLRKEGSVIYLWYLLHFHLLWEKGSKKKEQSFFQRVQRAKQD